MIRIMDRFIWTQNKENIVGKGILTIKDMDEYNRIVKKFKDISTYFFVGSSLYPGSSRNYTQYTAFGAKKYENFGETEEYIRSHFIRTYENPRRWVASLMAGDFTPERNLLDLFSKVEVGNCRERQIKEFEKAQMILIQLEKSLLSREAIKIVLEGLWPNFGYFATEGLNAVDIEMTKEYDVQELDYIAENSKKMGVGVSREVSDALLNRELAKSNGKVLSLAKKMNRLSNGI